MIKINDAAFAAISPITFPLLAFFLNYNKKMPSHMFFLYFVIALPIPLHPLSEHSKKFRPHQYESGGRNFFQPRRSNHHKSFLFFILQNGTLAQWLDLSVVAFIVFVEGCNLFRGNFHRVRHHVPLDIFGQRRCRQGT